jgi:hypothetical protein
MKAHVLSIQVLAGVVAGFACAAPAPAEDREPSIPTARAHRVAPSDDPLLKRVSAERRQTRSKAMRLKLRLTEAAEVTVRLRSWGRTWRPLQLRGRAGVNRVRITAGKDRDFPTGRYRVKVTARAGTVVSKPWKVSVRIVR